MAGKVYTKPMETKDSYEWILNQLPYADPFLFVDELHEVGPNGVRGSYTFKDDNVFYQGHFKDGPVTPGVLLTECCAQIGLVCLGISLLKQETKTGEFTMGMSHMQMDFLKPVFPGERVMVVSEKDYFRFGKLQCKVKMYNEQKELVCKGLLSGMLKMGKDHG